MKSFKVNEMVTVEIKLIGEVVSIEGDVAGTGI